MCAFSMQKAHRRQLSKPTSKKTARFIMSDHSSLSRKNLLHHTNHSNPEDSGSNFDATSVHDHDLQNYRLNSLFVDMQVHSDSDSSSISSTDPQMLTRGRTTTREEQRWSRLNEERSLSISPSVCRSHPKNSRYIDDLLNDANDVVHSLSISDEESITDSRLHNAKVTGRDEDGIPKIFDPDDSEMLRVSNHYSHQVTQPQGSTLTVERNKRGSPAPLNLRKRGYSDSSTSVERSQGHVDRDKQCENNEQVGIQSNQRLLMNRKRKSSDSYEIGEQNLKRNRSVPTEDRRFKTPKIRRNPTKDTKGFDLKVPKF